MNQILLLSFSLLVSCLDDFVVLPSLQNLNCLDILDRSDFFPIVLVAAELIQVYLFAETFVLLLDKLHYCRDLLAVNYFVVVHACD